MMQDTAPTIFVGGKKIQRRDKSSESKSLDKETQGLLRRGWQFNRQGDKGEHDEATAAIYLFLWQE